MPTSAVKRAMFDLFDDAADNKHLNKPNISSLYSRIGDFILNIGLVNFFEYLIVNLLLSIFVQRQQDKILKTTPGDDLTFF